MRFCTGGKNAAYGMTYENHRSIAGEHGGSHADAHALPSGAPVSIVSYNIHLAIGRDRRYLPERILAVLREIDADVVALQEVQLGARGFDMLGYLAEAAGYEPVAGPTLEHPKH